MAYSRLIFPFELNIQRVDRVATAAPPPGTSLTSGYDDVFGRVRSIPSGEQVGDSALIYESVVMVKAQVEEFTSQKQLRQGVGGSNAMGRVEVEMLRRELEAISWVLADGTVDLRPGDRLVSMFDTGGTKVFDAKAAFSDFLYVVNAQLDGYGGLSLASPLSGLVNVVFEKRAKTR